MKNKKLIIIATAVVIAIGIGVGITIIQNKKAVAVRNANR